MSLTGKNCSKLNSSPDELISEAFEVFKKPSKPKVHSEKERKKRIYKKFTNEQLDLLKKIYNENKYPSKNEMENIAQHFGDKYSKIENWFKHQRKIHVQNGLMKFTKKKAFSKQETQILMKEFLQCTKPKHYKIKEISRNLSCEVKNVKNWFGYKRKMILKIKKGKFLDQNQGNEEIQKKCEKLFEKVSNTIKSEKNKIEKSFKSDIHCKVEEIIQKTNEKEKNKEEKQENKIITTKLEKRDLQIPEADLQNIQTMNNNMAFFNNYLNHYANNRQIEQNYGIYNHNITNLLLLQQEIGCMINGLLMGNNIQMLNMNRILNI